jgi:ABC-type Fe3+/spermidine/putrescine transport system ATPase subunit
MITIRLTGLCKRFGPIRAVDDPSLEIVPGSLTAHRGPSGCGKSTALRLIAGLVEPDADDVAFDGRLMLGVPAERRAAATVL